MNNPPPAGPYDASNPSIPYPQATPHSTTNITDDTLFEHLRRVDEFNLALSLSSSTDEPTSSPLPQHPSAPATYNDLDELFDDFHASIPIATKPPVVAFYHDDTDMDQLLAGLELLQTTNPPQVHDSAPPTVPNSITPPSVEPDTKPVIESYDSMDMLTNAFIAETSSLEPQHTLPPETQHVTPTAHTPPTAISAPSAQQMSFIPAAQTTISELMANFAEISSNLTQLQLITDDENIRDSTGELPKVLDQKRYTKLNDSYKKCADLLEQLKMTMETIRGDVLMLPANCVAPRSRPLEVAQPVSLNIDHIQNQQIVTPVPQQPPTPQLQSESSMTTYEHVKRRHEQLRQHQHHETVAPVASSPSVQHYPAASQPSQCPYPLSAPPVHHPHAPVQQLQPHYPNAPEQCYPPVASAPPQHYPTPAQPYPIEYLQQPVSQHPAYYQPQYYQPQHYPPQPQQIPMNHPYDAPVDQDYVDTSNLRVRHVPL